MIRRSRLISAAFAALALPWWAIGCHDVNPSQDDRTGRGKGDQLPATGSGSQGTNAATGDITNEGPGSQVVGKAASIPGQSTPYGGGGAGVAPPVVPSKDAPSSGESNSGQKTGESSGPGSDASREGAKPAPNAGGPGTGTPPR